MNRTHPTCLLLLGAFLSSSLLAQLSATGNAILQQGGALDGSTEAGDQFAAALAVGNFDGDAYDDLAIGVPHDSVNGLDDAGVVHIVYGSRSGLTGDRDEIFNPDHQATAQFGAALAAMDFDCDGFDDLAVGSPGADLGLPPFGANDGGEVRIFFGSQNGLVESSVVTFDQSAWPQDDGPEANDHFGSALVGVSNGSNASPVRRLYIGSPGEGVTFGSSGNQGAVFGLINFCDGDGFVAGDRLHQDVSGFGSSCEDFDYFGETLDKGDFNGDGVDDLVIGVPFEDLTANPSIEAQDEGAVHVVYGTTAGSWTGSNEQFWHQDVAGILDDPENGESFGDALTTGDFDRDGFDELVASVGEFDLGGGAHVIYGGASGLSEVGDQLWIQDGQVANPEPGDLFGSDLAAGDFDGDGTDDLGVGVKGEDVGTTADAGAIVALYGVAFFGLDTPGTHAFNQNSSGFAGVAEADDEMGRTLAAGDFNGDGRHDLAVGIPLEDVGNDADVGVVHLVYGSDGGILGEVEFDTANVAVVTENPQTVTLTVRRAGPTNLALTVGHRLQAGGSATQGADFTYTPGTLTWSAGDASDRTIAVQILDDSLTETVEVLRIELHDPSTGSGLGSPSRRTIQITDDDAPDPIFADGFESGSTDAWSATVP